MFVGNRRTDQETATPRIIRLARRGVRTSLGAILLGAAVGLAGPDHATGSETSRGATLFAAECAGCHGPDAWGGRDGQYPRLAGLPAGYVKRQLESFRDRRRQNKPMLPIFKAGRLRGDDITAVATHLAALPPPEPERVGIPAAPDYDRALGQRLYLEACARCHGLDGNGEPNTDHPPVTRQYPAYLVKQLRDFRKGERRHAEGETLIGSARPADLDALLGYMLDLSRGVPDPPAP
jgi:cytochrome c553